MQVKIFISKVRKNDMKILKIYLTALAMILFLLLPVNTKAASTATHINNLIDALSRYEFVILHEMNANTAKTQKIKLSKKEIAQAASLSIDPLSLKGARKDDRGSYDTFLLPISKAKKAAKNIFGRTVVKTDFPKQTKEKRWQFDAYRKGKDILYYVSRYENELACQVVNQSITSKGNEYIVKKYLYYGYWGWFEGNANRLVTYTVKKSAASRYKYVVKSISLRVLDSDYTIYDVGSYLNKKAKATAKILGFTVIEPFHMNSGTIHGDGKKYYPYVNSPTYLTEETVFADAPGKYIFHCESKNYSYHGVKVGMTANEITNILKKYGYNMTGSSITPGFYTDITQLNFSFNVKNGVCSDWTYSNCR